jgi:hypothetical protein
MQICVYVCVYSVKNALISFKKSANEFTMRKFAKNLSVVVPQLSAVLLRVRSPSCSLTVPATVKDYYFYLILNFMKVDRFSDSYYGF